MKRLKNNWHWFDFSSSIERTAFCMMLKRKGIAFRSFYDSERAVYVVEVSDYGFYQCVQLIGEQEKTEVFETISHLGGNI